MTDTVSVRVTDGDVWVDGEHLTRGDEVEIPTGVYERLPESFEQVDDATGEDDDATNEDQAADQDEAAKDDVNESDADTVTIDDLDPHPADLTVDELEERIADVDDVALLETIRAAETDDDGRTTAIKAIDARLDELEG